jgi:Spy/CpxP family protein refolding chaperone
MKNSILWLFLGCVITLAPALFAEDDASSKTTDNSAVAPSDGNASTAGQGQHTGFWKQALEQLNLSDGQKQQIKQIVDNSQPGKERRQQIMAVLTPDQKQQLVSLIKEHRAEEAGQ